MAALAVCLLHSTPVFGFHKFMSHAYLVVDFFFCLSGYILVERYKDPILGRGNGRGISFRHFSVIRLARLYPLYAVALVLGAVYTVLRLATTAKLSGNFGLVETSLAAAVFVLPYFHTGVLHAENAAFPYVTQSWSLFWELIASGLFYYWVRYGKIGTVVVSSMVGLLAVILLAFPQNAIDGGWQTFNFWLGGARALFSFSTGILIANLQAIKRLKAGATSGPVLNASGYAAFAIAALYIVSSMDANIWVELVIVSMAFPLVILTFSDARNVFVNNKVGSWLGEISYSVYLLHGTFVILLLTFISKSHFIHASALTGVLCVASILVVSTFVRKWIELPAQNWLKGQMKMRAKPVAAPAE